MAFEELTVYGPGGVHLTLNVLVDTGDTQTVLPESVARKLNLPILGNAPVQTNNGVRDFQWSKAWVSVRGLVPIEVPIWVAPNDVEAAIGEVTLAEFGARIVFPPRQWGGPPPHPEVAGRGPPPTPRQPAPKPGVFSGKLSANLSICASCVNRRPGLVDICGICGCPCATRALTSCPMGYF